MGMGEKRREKGLEGQWRVVEGWSKGGPEGGVWRGVMAAAGIMPASQPAGFLREQRRGE